MDPIRFRWRTCLDCCHSCARSMRCSRKFPVLLVCLALAVGANAANKDEKPKDGKSKDVKKETAKKKDKAKGDAKKPSATPEPTTGDEAKPKPKLSLPLAKGY